MRTDLGKKRFDCRSSKWRKDFAQKCKFGTNFFSTLDFIWKSHSLQFLVYALPIRFWQVLMKLKNPKVKILVIFFRTFVLNGRAIDFNFWAVPCLLEYDQPLYFFFFGFCGCGPVAQHVLSFPKNNSISPITTNFYKSVLRHWVCLLWRVQNRHCLIILVSIWTKLHALTSILLNVLWIIWLFPSRFLHFWGWGRIGWE